MRQRIPIQTKGERAYGRGMSGLIDDAEMPPRVIYSDNGEPLIYGVDENGYPIVIGQDSAQPWWSNLINQGIQTTGQVFSNRGYYDTRQGAALQAQLTPQGISTGFNLSSNTLLLIGVVAAFFLLEKRR